MLQVNNLIGFGSRVNAASPIISGSWVSSAKDAVNRITYTFSSQNIGAADSTRKVVVCVVGTYSSGTSVVSSVTVGGVSATLVVSDVHNGSYAGIWIATVPIATSADVVVTWASTMLHCGISIYRLLDASSTATETDSDTVDPIDMVLSPAANTFVIGTGINYGGASWTWTGITEDVNLAVGENNAYVASASDFFASASPLLAIKGDPAGGTTNAVGVCAVFTGG